jgi:hypothetical protein
VLVILVATGARVAHRTALAAHTVAVRLRHVVTFQGNSNHNDRRTQQQQQKIYFLFIILCEGRG